MTNKGKEPLNETVIKERNLNNKRLCMFLLLVFGITYFLEFFIILPGMDSTDDNQRMMAQSLVSFIMLVPAISVVITRLITKEGFKGSGVYVALNLKKDLRYYVFAWIGTALLILLGTAIYFLIFPGKFDPDMGYAKQILESQTGSSLSTEVVRNAMIQQVIMAIVLSPIVNAVYCFGEEWGWRGYLLPKMMKNLKIIPVLIINGVIWGLWHAPLTAMGHNYGIGYPGYPFLGIFSMCVFCIVIGMIASYITIKTKSCIPSVILHGMLNGYGTIGIYFSSTENPYNVFLGPMPTGLIGASGFIVVAVLCAVHLYRDEKQNKLVI